MKESVMYHTIKEKAPNTKFWRVENTLNLGTPDIHLVNKYGGAWLEAKQLTLTSSNEGHITVPFRPAQYSWLRNYHKHGGTSLLGIVTEYGFFFARNDAIKESYTRKEMHYSRENPFNYLEYDVENGWKDKLHFVYFDDLDSFFQRIV